MYLSKEQLLPECPSLEQFNCFQYWREPVPDISLIDLDILPDEVKDKNATSQQYDSFLYWRDPIPEIDIFDF